MVTSIVPAASSHPGSTAQTHDVSTWQNRSWAIAKEVALTSLPFLTLYKPFSFPVSLGIGALRVGISAVQLAKAIEEGDAKQIFSELTHTAVAVISLAGTIFAHPLGMLISTGYDLILEFRTLVQHMREGKYQEALESCIKILGHALYFAVFIHGGPEIAMCFFAVQILTGILEARHEFVAGHYIAGVGHALMSMLRGGQLVGQVKALQTQREVKQLIQKINNTDPTDPQLSEYVGKLAEKWEFPSDHLPVGAKVGNAHVISWNILNNHFMKWVTELDSQGLKGSLISKLNDIKSTKYPGLTMRDELIMVRLNEIMKTHRKGLILSLQECSPEFLRAFTNQLPKNMEIISPGSLLKNDIDYNAVVYSKDNFIFLKDQSFFSFPFIESDPLRPAMNLVFLEKATGQKFQIINAHIPGDPLKPGRYEYARYVLTYIKKDCHTICNGDMNFNHNEMQMAFEQEAAALNMKSPFKNLVRYNTNIEPGTFVSKSIDHIWVNTDLPCKAMKPNEVMSRLQKTVDLLHPHQNALAVYKIQQLQQWYRKQQELQEAQSA